MRRPTKLKSAGMMSNSIGATSPTTANRTPAIVIVLPTGGVLPNSVRDISSPITATRARLSTSSGRMRSEEHTSELQSLAYLVCRLLLEKKKKTIIIKLKKQRQKHNDSRM